MAFKMCVVISIIAICFCNSTGQETFNDHENSFNKYLFPENGVDLFTGTANFSDTLSSINCDSVFPFSLKLDYSSNVRIDARARNDVGPTKWVGLGWNLSYGSVYCDHKGTKTHDDDDFCYISPDGVKSKIIRNEGLNFSYYKGQWNDIPDFSSLTPALTGNTRGFDMDFRDINDPHFGFRFEGSIYLPSSGTYTFYSNSSDGSRLYLKINGSWNLIVDNSGTHVLQEHSGTTTLNSGYYDLRVDYFSNIGSQKLEVSYSGPGISKQAIPGAQLFPCTATSRIRTWYLEKDPYAKVEPIDVNGDSIYEGWIITTKDGVRLKYGNLDLGDRKATRYTFQENNFVGEVLSGTPSLYPYQWDLSSIQKPSGKEIAFQYYQVTQQLKFGSWTSPVEYTQASYLNKITMPSGFRFEFINGTENEVKNADEYVDANTLSPEPDGTMEFYENLLLHSIRVYGPSGALIRKFQFNYAKINQSLSGKFLKSVLTAISESNGSSKILRTRTMTYYDDLNKLDTANTQEYEENYNYGALKSYCNGLGSIKEIEYVCNTITNKLRGSFVTTPDAGGYHPLIQIIGEGELDDGNPYFVAIGDYLQMSVYNWDGVKWVCQDYLPTTPMGIDSITQICACKNYFLIRAGSNYDLLSAYNWNGEKWVNSIIKRLERPASPIAGFVIHPGNDYFALTSGTYQECLEIWNWNGKNWVNTFPRQCFPKQIQVAAGDNYLGVVCHTVGYNGQYRDRITIYNWTGTEWQVDPLYNDMAFPGDCGAFDLYSGGKHLFIRSGTWKEKLRILTRLGDHWTRTYPLNGIDTAQGVDLSDTESSINIHPEPDYVAVTTGPYNQKLTLLNWTGQAWQVQDGYLKKLLTYDPVQIHTGSDYFAVGQGPFCGMDNKLLTVYNWNGAHWSLTKGPDTIGGWYQGLTVAANGHTITAISYPECPLPEPMHCYHNRFVFSWTGKSWKTVFHDGQDVRLDDEDLDCQLTANDKFITAILPWASRFKAILYKKLGNSFGEDINLYSVSKITLKSKSGVPDQEINYAFDTTTANYDTYNGTVMYNKAKIAIPGKGHITKYFFNRSTNNGQSAQPGYDTLDGYEYKTCVFGASDDSEAHTPLREDDLTYSVYKAPGLWPMDVNDKRVIKIGNKQDGVIEEKTIQYNDINGSPAYVAIKNSNGKYKVDKIKYAFEDAAYAQMADANMLAEPCQVTEYEKPAEYSCIDPSPGEIRAAHAITYSNSLGCNAWLPYKTFSWKSAFNADLTPVEAFADYSHSSPSSNTHWDLVTSNDKYDSYGAVAQTSKPGLGPNVINYRNDIHQPIGAVSNANFYESGLYTGDYDLDEPGIGSGPRYLDKNNGWEKNGTISFSTDMNQVHFGQKALYIQPGASVMRNFKIRGNTRYTLSVWIKPTSTTTPMNMYIEYRKGPSTVSSWPVSYTDLGAPVTEQHSITGRPDGKWNLIKIITQSQSGDDNWIRISIGKTGDPGAGYVDDIRFYPEHATVVSNYYTPDFCQPIVTADANAKSGHFRQYDEFGRLAAEIKGSQTSNDTIKRFTYYITKDGDYIIVCPKQNDSYSKGGTLPIVFNNFTGRDVNIYLSSDNGATWGNPIHSIQATNGVTYYAWGFVIPTSYSSGATYYIKIADANDPNFYCIQGSFAIR